MFISKASISRRTVLRGIGTAVALPLLDAMIPAACALAATSANPVRRLGVVYLPNGMAMDYWTPKSDGPSLPSELSPVLKPLNAFRDQIVLVSGLDGPQGGGGHAGAATLFLTGMCQENARAGARASTSMDQYVAKSFGTHTQLSSLELGLDEGSSGACDGQFSCDLTNSIAWRSPTTPLPTEYNPRVVFERLFGDSGSTDAAARSARLQQDQSILDSISESVADLRRSVGTNDSRKISEYLDAVRDIERRIQKAEEQTNIKLPTVEQPVGVPATFEEHIKLMFDLQVLAYQCDLTRVITFMVGRELTGRTYSEIGVPDAHHPLSHHQEDPAKIATLSKINVYHAQMFSYYLAKLRATPDGDGSLLDHMVILYGAGMSDSNDHDHHNLPILLAGGASGRLKGGRMITAPGAPVANLLTTIMDKLDVPIEKFPNSTGELPLDRLSGV